MQEECRRQTVIREDLQNSVPNVDATNANTLHKTFGLTASCLPCPSSGSRLVHFLSRKKNKRKTSSGSIVGNGMMYSNLKNTTTLA
jgi:hypothetical protein